MLEKQSGVALLIHDFAERFTSKHGDVEENDDGGSGQQQLTGEFSITLNGNCSVVKDGKMLFIVVIHDCTTVFTGPYCD